MTDDAIKAMLDALRAQIDALEVMLVGTGQADAPTGGPCQHPPDKREPHPMPDEPRQFLCKECMTVIHPDAPKGQE